VLEQIQALFPNVVRTFPELQKSFLQTLEMVFTSALFSAAFGILFGVALVVTAGAYLRGSQQPFATKSPTGDDSFRIIPNETPIEEIALAHPGYNTRRALQDLDCVFPLALLNHFQQQGEIGAAAPRHFSFVGFIPQTERLLTEIAPQVGTELIRDQVDLALLVPS
jgi:D-proline reductase (dithiol) PrdB